MTVNGFRTTLVAVCLTMAAASSASAQVFGTFSWQMQPFCNIVTMTITQIPGGYTIDGNDNQCGAGKLAGAAGMALVNPDGTVGLEFTIVTAPSGKAVHVSASLSPATGSGPWTDSVGNSGNLQLGAPGSGSPRPLPTSGVAPATITTVELAPAAVGAAQLAANAVTGASVVDGSLTNADLLDGPRAAFADGGQTAAVVLSGADQIIRSVTITAPAAGRVVVNASAEWRATSTTTLDLGRCSITSGITLDTQHLHRLGEENGTSVGTILASSFSATRGFAVAAGAFTVNLVCDSFSGSAEVRVSSMTAMYFPG